MCGGAGLGQRMRQMSAGRALPRQGQGRPWLTTALRLVLAACCAAACAALAMHHPLSPTLAWAASGLLAAWVFVWPRQWPTLLMGLLPVAGLATWTGWLTFEELDLLVLAIAAGGHARWALLGWHDASAAPGGRPLPGGKAWLLLLAFAGSVAVSLQRGLADAGGAQFDWWQSYLEPMNSVRLAKPFAWAMLLLPLWWLPAGRDGRRVGSRQLVLGLQAALGVMALLVTWERVAFPGLLNFSTDYRTTALFWEMHVGGAALDACLAMAFPFALQALWTARRP